MEQNAVTRTVQTVTQFELQNLIRKTRIFKKANLTSSAKFVLESLVFHFPKIRVKVETLADENDISKRSVENGLKELKEKGLIIITHTGRSSIYNFTQKFFDLLELSPQICKPVRTRSATVAVPHNKQENKKNNKTFQEEILKNETNEVNKLLKKDSWLSNKLQAEVVLNSFHQFNTKEQNYKAIIQIKENWNFETKDFAILRYFEEKKQTDMLFRKKIENLELETKLIFQNIDKTNL